jgi:hypothetical protein
MRHAGGIYELAFNESRLVIIHEARDMKGDSCDEVRRLTMRLSDARLRRRPVESRCGAVTVGASQLLPPLSSGGVAIDDP